MRNGQAYQQKTEKFFVSEEKSLVRLTPGCISDHDEDELPHPVSACIFCIALHYLGSVIQRKLSLKTYAEIGCRYLAGVYDLF